MELKEIIAKNIQITRIDLGKTQKEVATALGTSEQSYNRIESGKFFPSTENLYKLAEFFNVSVDYLLGRESEFSESQLTEYLSTLSEEQLFSLEMQVKALRLQLKAESDSQQVTEEKKTINSDLSMNLKQPE